jgi:HK97 family phage portal protein
MALWGQGSDIESSGVYAGVSVSQSNSLQLVAVYACVRLLSQTIAGLPADVFRKRNGTPEPVEPGPSWLRMPNPETTWFEFTERVMGSLNLDGNAFVIITGRDAMGFPAECWTLNPREVQVRREGGKTIFVWGGDERLSRFSPSTPDGDVLHIKAFSDGGLRGLSPIGLAKQAIGLGMVTEKFGAEHFGSGQKPPGIIEIPPGTPQATTEIVDKLREDWKRHHAGSNQAHAPGILVGATWKDTSINAEEAQFLETRKFQVSEIARLFGVPPHMIGDVEKSTSWGTGIEQQSIGFVTYSITPWLVRLESAFNQLTPRGQFIKWNVNGLLRGDMAARSAFHHEGILDGWQTRNGVRLLEELPPIPGLDEPLVPANMLTLSQSNAPPRPDQEEEPAAVASQ